MVIELALIFFMSPTTVLLPKAGTKVFSLVWFFLHPGSTNTSGLIGFYSNILDEIEKELNRGRETRRCAQEAPAERPMMRPRHRLVVARNAVQEPPQRVIQDGRPPAIDIVQGTGSVEGFGLVAVCPQNLDMSVGFYVEGKMWFRFLENEGGVNQAIVTTLFKRARWKRHCRQEEIVLNSLAFYVGLRRCAC